MDYNRVHANPNKETSMKLILATILAGSFLVSLPVRADDKAPAGDSAAGGKSGSKSGKKKKKSDKSGDKKTDDSASKPSGGGW